MNTEDLNAVRDLKASINAYEETLHSFQSLITAGVPLNDGMPKSQRIDSAVERLGIRIADVSKKIDDLKEKISVEAENLEKKILGEIDNVKAQTILILRYVECMTFDRIGQVMNYSEKHIRRLHKNILEGIKNGWSI